MFIAVLRPAESHWHAMSLAIMPIVAHLYIPNSFFNALLLAFATTAVFLALALRLGRMAPWPRAASTASRARNTGPSPSCCTRPSATT